MSPVGLVPELEQCTTSSESSCHPLQVRGVAMPFKAENIIRRILGRQVRDDEFVQASSVRSPSANSFTSAVQTRTLQVPEARKSVGVRLSSLPGLPLVLAPRSPAASAGLEVAGSWKNPLGRDHGSEFVLVISEGRYSTVVARRSQYQKGRILGYGANIGYLILGY